MDMSQPVSRHPVDADALAEALGTLGLMYGDREALGVAAAGAADEAEAVRTFISRERAHVLGSYDLDALVTLVLAARARNARSPVSIETYSPA